MLTSHFDSNFTQFKYKGYTICKGILYVYQDDVEIQRHFGHGVYRGAMYLGFRFTQKAAKSFVDYHDLTCIL